jgi:hypothetical protein
MIDRDRVRLLHGPYTMPRLRVGDRTTCLLRDCEVVVTSITDASIPWPRCRALGDGRGGGSGLWLGGDLAKAVRRESAAAVMHWWRVSATSLWHMRRALGVTRTNNEGTRRLMREASQFGADVMRERDWTDAERDARRDRAERLNLGRHLRDGYNATRAWKPGELRLLGTLPDAEVARRTGRPVNAVRIKRTRLGIPTAKGRRRR